MTIRPIPDVAMRHGHLYSRTCIHCAKSMILISQSIGFDESPSGRPLFAVYGLDFTGHSTLRGILDSSGANFSCLRCHSKRWLSTLTGRA
jgi:hypothetical protein